MHVKLQSPYNLPFWRDNRVINEEERLLYFAAFNCAIFQNVPIAIGMF